MGRENVENWHVRKCAKACDGCEEAFVDKQVLYSRLMFDEGEYIRHDFCEKCWKDDDAQLSTWKTIFIIPPPPAIEPVKKENVESLLRKLMAKENEEDLHAIFILTVMLERKKILVERDSQRNENGQKLRIYEHKKTGESMIVVDPELKLDELEKIQEEVALLLGAKPRNPEQVKAETEVKNTEETTEKQTENQENSSSDNGGASSTLPESEQPSDRVEPVPPSN